MQLPIPPTVSWFSIPGGTLLISKARGFLVPWELNAYSLAVLQQQISAFLQEKKSTFCGIQCIQRPPCTEVYIYATEWKDDWKKAIQDICYKATATGAGMGMGMGMGYATVGCTPGYDAPMVGGCGAMMGMGGMGMGGMGMTAGGGMGGMGMGAMGGMGMMGDMGCGTVGGFGLGPACPPMMHGAPVNWGHRPLPVLSDRMPKPAAAAAGGGGTASDRRPIPKI